MLSHLLCLPPYWLLLLKFLVVFALSIFMVQLVVNWILEILNVYSWGIHHQRSTNVTILLLVNILCLLNLLTWKSKKHNVVARSSAEVEYRAMAHTAMELTWFQHFLQEKSFPLPIPIPLFCDNQATLHIASNLHSMRGLSTLKHIVILSETRC
jgi:hypothetical protein